MAFAEVTGVVRDIMRYFVQHPAAADSVEGIARWRLLQQRVQDVVQETDAALALLVGRDIILEIRTGSAPPLFRLNPEKSDEVRRLLEGGE
jgi:hypothetical protein